MARESIAPRRSLGAANISLRTILPKFRNGFRNFRLFQKICTYYRRPAAGTLLPAARRGLTPYLVRCELPPRAHHLPTGYPPSHGPWPSHRATSQSPPSYSRASAPSSTRRKSATGSTFGTWSPSRLTNAPTPVSISEPGSRYL